MDIKSVKVQATIYGHAAWVIEQLMARKRDSMANITAYIFTRWMDDNEDYLRKFKLTLEDFKEYLAKEEGGEAEILNYPDRNA